MLFPLQLIQNLLFDIAVKVVVEVVELDDGKRLNLPDFSAPNNDKRTA